MSEALDADLTPKKKLTKKEKQHLFLDAYADHANVLLSARAAGVSRQMVYQWLEHDTDFSFALNQWTLLTIYPSLICILNCRFRQ
jgi:hypothetical protein